MNKKLILLIFFLGYGILLKAQQIEYSLADIVQLSRSQSTAWLSAETRKENNYWLYKTYKSDYNPQLVLSGMLPSFTKSVTPITQPDGNVIYREVNNNTLDIQLGLNQIIAPTGASISVFSNLNRYDDFIQDYTQYSGQPVSIGLNQPIFQFNQYRWNKLIKPLEYEESQKKYFEELEQISINATRRFFDLLLAQIQLEIAEKNVQSNDTIYKIAQGRYNLGKITENDLLQLELNLVNSTLEVSQARVDQQQASLNLKSFIGLSDDNVVVQLIIPDEIPLFTVDENVALVEAKKNKADFISFERRLLQAEQEVARAKRSSGVNMNLNAVYGVAGVSGQDQFIGEVYQNTSDNVRLGLQLNVPVLDWGRQKSRIMTAQANQKLVQYQLQQDEETFEQEVLTQVRNFNLLREQLESRIKSDEIAQKAYNISKQLFIIGKISITELNASLVSKDLAKRNYISSLRDFWTAYYQLREKTLYDFARDQLLVRDIQTD
jgi:outer membrane protein TolC